MTVPPRAVVCVPAGAAGKDEAVTDPGPHVVLVRHGETEWSRARRHTGRTDLELTATGEAQAGALRPLLARQPPDVVLCSPLRRARRTAELAALTPYEVDDDLREWDYGDFEGLTSAEIARSVPGWSIWDGPWPGGETAAQVTARVDRAVQRILREPAGARVAVVAHGHLLRSLAARWLGEPLRLGRLLGLDTATVCELGWEHRHRVLRRWNVRPEGGAPPGGPGESTAATAGGRDGATDPDAVTVPGRP